MQRGLYFFISSMLCSVTFLKKSFVDNVSNFWEQFALYVIIPHKTRQEDTAPNVDFQEQEKLDLVIKKNVAQHFQIILRANVMIMTVVFPCKYRYSF